MKIVMFGSGAAGGAVGAYLAKAGEDVTFIARGEHLKAMKENGLLLMRSFLEDAEKDILIKPIKAMKAAEYNDTPDVIFVTVKYYSIEDAIDFARRVAAKDTLIIPILNVFGTGAVMQEKLSGLICLDGCMYIYAKITKPGAIEQSEELVRVIYGFRKNQPIELKEKCEELEKILKNAKIRGHFSQNIERDALRKFAFVSPMGATLLYYNALSGAIQKEGEPREMFIGLIKEAVAIGEAMGIEFDVDLVETGKKFIDSSLDNLSTSMVRDVQKGGLSEFDGQVRRIVELGKKLGVPTPLYQKVAEWGDKKGI